jgi:hypothetical protein
MAIWLGSGIPGRRINTARAAVTNAIVFLPSSTSETCGTKEGRNDFALYRKNIQERWNSFFLPHLEYFSHFLSDKLARIDQMGAITIHPGFQAQVQYMWQSL